MEAWWYLGTFSPLIEPFESRTHRWLELHALDAKRDELEFRILGTPYAYLLTTRADKNESRETRHKQRLAEYASFITDAAQFTAIRFFDPYHQFGSYEEVAEVFPEGLAWNRYPLSTLLTGELDGKKGEGFEVVPDPRA